MKTVFLYGYYGCGNVGDDLLLSVVTKQVLDWSPDARVIIKCLNVPPVEGGDRIEFETCERILADPALPRRVKVWRYSLRMWKALHGVSALVFGGGTLFHAEKGSPVNLLLLLSVACMARLRGAHVYALGVGVTPLCGAIPRILMSALLLLSRDFAVRDAASFECCQALAGRRRVRKTADLVFLADFPARATKQAGGRVLGLTLASSAIRGQSGNDNNALREIVRALNQLAEDGWTLRFLSFQELTVGNFRLSDSVVFESLKDAGLEANAALIEVNSENARLAEVFSDLDLVVGMRFHGLVMAAVSGIPFIGIGKDHKLSNLCAKYEFPFFSIDDLCGGKLIAAVKASKEKIPDPRITQELQLAARANFQAFEDANLGTHVR
jgi:polysaccharide pyruvyl transferase WcaK-like protein